MDDLTEAEIALIRQHRENQARQADAEAFQIKAIATAHAFSTWSTRTGEALTYSTFINTFNYQEADGKLMYEAVKRIHAAAWPHTH